MTARDPLPDALLQPYRAALNECDDRLLACLRDRFEIIRRVGTVKRDNAIPIMQSRRVAEIGSKVAKFADEQDLSEQFMRSLYDLIIAEACRIEEAIVKGE
ncbi:chorismate mutase [Bradyrhizobium sp. 930_D9_N1_4]|uniref:chorismate mutase n=1 Tax=Bradyrhizobium sp. 930_D9_N1_4 TaxID=3240374 RepID=UPI003F8AA073